MRALCECTAQPISPFKVLDATVNRAIFLNVVFYCHEVIGAVSHRLPPLEIRRKSHSFGSRHMRCVSVRLNPSPLSRY